MSMEKLHPNPGLRTSLRSRPGTLYSCCYEEGKTATLPFLPTQWYHFYYYSFLILCLFMGSRSFAQSNTYDSSAWIPNGKVNAMASYGNTVYLAGEFTYIGPAQNVSRASAFDAVTGQPIPNFPTFNNYVRAIVPDGSGGWYIGGDFTMVAGQTRNRIARINGDGSLHPWNPDIDDQVNTIAVSGNKVYVGGYFSTVNGGAVTRNKAAAFDANTGLATPWDPDVLNPTWSEVYTITVSDSLVFLGGYFNGVNTSRGNILRNGFAAVDTSTGVASSWNPRMGSGYSYINTMTTDGTTLFVGGYFSSMGDSARKNLASFNLSTLELTLWNPNPSSNINTMLVAGSKVYLGGGFNQLNDSVPRKNIGSVDKTTGTVSAWNPIFINGNVKTMAMMGGALYAGGDFKDVNGISSNRLVALDTITGNRTPCDLQVDKNVFTVAASGGIIYAGGDFTSAGGKGRNNAAAINASTGEVTPWNPNVGTIVYTMAAARGLIYIGGSFNKANGNIERRSIVAVDTVSGTLTSWNPKLMGMVKGIVVRGDTVYVGGWWNSTNVNDSLSRSTAAAIDANTGVVTSWDPNVSSNTVVGLAEYRDTIYLGLEYPGLLNGSTPRDYLGAVDANMALATGFDPKPDGFVQRMKVLGDRLYVGGNINNIMGAARKSVAAIELNTGNLSNWDPAPTWYGNSNPIKAINPVGGVVYLGGAFNQINGSATRESLAVVDTVLGTVLPWTPATGGNGIEGIEVIGNKIFVGGNMSASALRQKYLQIYSCTSPTSGGTISTDQSGYAPFYPSGFSSVSGASGHSGALEYKWQASTTSSSAGFSDIAGAIYEAYQPDTLTQTTWFKRLARTCGNTWTAAIESNVIEVTVTYCTNPTSGGTIATAQSGLSPFDPAPFTNSTAASGHSGTLEYKWQFSTTSDSTGFSDIASSNSNVYDAGSLAQTTWYKRVARVGCKSDWTGAAASNVLKVTVIIPKTWTGGNGNWNVAANWSDGAVPVNADHLLINTGNPKLNVDYTVGGSLTLSGTGSLTVEAGKTLLVDGVADFGSKSVIFKSDATGTAQLGKVTGTLNGANNVTVERFIPATGRKWRLLTAPLDNVSINAGWQNGETWNGTSSLVGGTTGTLITGQQQGNAATANSRGFDFWSAVSNSSTSLMTYIQQAGEGTWSQLPNTTSANAFNNNKAYIIFIRGPRSSAYSSGSSFTATTLRPTGTLRQGTINVPVDGSKGYTLVGNPYASQIDFDSIYRNSGNSSVIKRQLWLWDAAGGSFGNYHAVLYSGDKYIEVPRKFHASGQATPLTAIQSGYGFFVLPLTSSGGVMQIRESNKLLNQPVTPNILLNEDKTPRLFVNLMKSGTDGNYILTDGVMVSYGPRYRFETTDAEDAIKLDNLYENMAVQNSGVSLIADARPLSDMQKEINLKLWNLTPGSYRFDSKFYGTDIGVDVNAYLEDKFSGMRQPLSMKGDLSSVEFNISNDSASKAADRFRIVFSRSAINGSLTPDGDIAGNQLSVYPNPVTGRIVNIKLQQVQAGKYQLQLVSTDGKIVADKRIEHDGGAGTYQLNLNGSLPHGNYILRCSVGDQMISQEKLIIQ